MSMVFFNSMNGFNISSTLIHTAMKIKITIRVDNETKRQFKSNCAKEGDDMSTIIEMFMEVYNKKINSKYNSNK